MKGNLILIHGGGPTAVINASLYGAIMEAKKHPEVNRVLAAIGGTGGLLKGDVADVTDVPEAELKLLLQTPGSAIGTSRDALEKEDYEKMPAIFEQLGVKYVLMNGGNGTMDTCGRICEACRDRDIRVMGIPKTMDNDLAVTDHAPGFGSAARYMAQSVAEVAADVQGLPIHVVVIEALGRNAGWITAASQLAWESGAGPDLIYLPEVPFDEEKFLEDVKALIEKKRGVVVVASEGLKYADGKPIVEPVFQVGRSVYFGDVSAHLSQLVTKKLGYKSRSEKPGLLGRASMALLSPVDQAEAQLAGEEAVRAAIGGQSGKMVAFVRESTEPYRISTTLVDVHEVMMTEKTLPREYINERGNGVTEAFIKWCKPLLGAEIPRMLTLKGAKRV